MLFKSAYLIVWRYVVCIHTTHTVYIYICIYVYIYDITYTRITRMLIYIVYTTYICASLERDLGYIYIYTYLEPIGI